MSRNLSDWLLLWSVLVMYRLYVDEVGNDDLTHTSEEAHRFLSLTGVVMKIDHARDHLTPSMNWIKSDILDHDPDEPAILHRTDIVQRKKGFWRLNDDAVCDLFDRAIIRLITSSDFRVITALIDKHWMLGQKHWTNMQPYHYLMEILVEKYVQYLERMRSVGDIMPESRQGADKRLQRAYDGVRDAGTRYVSKDRIESALRAPNLKFRAKKENTAGIQLCDLIAHPSHIYVRQQMNHDVTPGAFCQRVTQLLIDEKYDRSAGGLVRGYGIKHLP